MRAAVLACTLICLAAPAARVAAQTDRPAPAADMVAADKSAPGDKAAAADKSSLPPLPAEAHVQQSMQLDGKTLKYTVTVGALPVRDKDGKTAGEVVVTAYTVEGDNRPVTFALNGGPGRFYRVL